MIVMELRKKIIEELPTGYDITTVLCGENRGTYVTFSNEFESKDIAGPFFSNDFVADTLEALQAAKDDYTVIRPIKSKSSSKAT